MGKSDYIFTDMGFDNPYYRVKRERMRLLAQLVYEAPMENLPPEIRDEVNELRRCRSISNRTLERLGEVLKGYSTQVKVK